MFNNKKKIEKHKNDIEKYNANKAHQEMVDKAGGGLNNLLELLDTKNYNIEILEQHIARLTNEIYNMEKQILNLGICYEFRNSFITIKINKFFLKQKFKQKFKKLYYILNVIHFIKFKNIIILLNLIFFLQHLKLF